MAENIRIAILSADDEVCAFLDNSVDKCMHYWDDVLHTYLQGSQYTFECRTLADHEDTQFIVEGNHCSFRDGDHEYYCTIVHVEKDEEEVYFQAYGLTLELTNETVDAYKGTSMSFQQYLSAYGFENTFKIGVNEVSDKRISHEWTGQETILARLFSTANVFDAELEFITELNDDYSLKQITLNVYRKHSADDQGVGEDKTGTIIRYGADIQGITKTSDITELYTSIRPTGKDGLTLAGLGEKKEYDEDGNLAYWHAAGNRDIRAMKARDQFPSLAMGADNDRWIVSFWDYDTDNVNTLYGQALAQLKKNCVPKMSYDVDGYIDGNIGDTYTIEDAEFHPTLYLQARIVEQEKCFTDPSQSKTTLDNFTELESQISDDLLKRMEALIELNKTFQIVVSSSNGIVLPPDVPSTVLSVKIKDGPTDVTDKYTVKWYVENDLIYTGTSLSVLREDLEPSVVYRIEAVDSAGRIRAETEVTVSQVNDGSTITITNTVITYQISDSGTAIPTGTWVSEIPEVEPGQYLWVRTVVTYSNGQTVTTHSVSRNGVDGSDGTDGSSVTIISTSVVYQAHTSGTVPPTGAWDDDVPNVGQGQFLWTRTTVVYSDGQETVSYGVSRSGSDGQNGQDGTSVSITETSVQYQVSDSGTEPPTGTWSSSVPTVGSGQYLWTRTQVTYSDGQTITSYSVSRNGVDGADGTAPYTMIIDSSEGQIFKNEGIETTLTAHVYQGPNEITGSDLAQAGDLKWYKDNGSEPSYTGSVLTITEGEVESSVTYRVQLEKNGEILSLGAITLATVTDIQGIYRFYQLSTAAPATPAVYPPASPWQDTEPEFDLTSQGSLYYVDCTLFSDLSFQYGEVQMSSDYEAVKLTYADAIEQIANSKQEISAEIQEGDDLLRQEVAETYYSAEDVDTKLGEVSTAFEQTQNYIEMQFESFQADLENLNADNTAQFQQIQKYIRFEDGNIILGESGNELILTIQNDRISFSQGGQEVAYFSNNKLNVTDADVVHTLRIGSFIFSPRPDGSLDFKKAGDDD